MPAEERNFIPVPEIDDFNRPYFEALERGLLTYQVCSECASNVWPPRGICPYCLSDKLHWRESSGHGEVYSCSTVYHAPFALWDDKVPYSLGIIHLDEDYYLFSEIVAEPDKVRIGAPVQCRIRRDESLGVFLPRFVPAEGN